MAWNVVNFLALSGALATLATISVALRFWAHTKSGNRAGIDDALIVVALIGVVGMVVAEVIGTQIGGMAQHQKNVIDSDGLLVYTKQLENYEKCNYAIQILSLTSLGFSKTSVLIFYRRVFFVYKRFLIANNLLTVVVVMWTLAFFFSIVFQCPDPRTLWTTFEWTRGKCVDNLKLYYALAISGFLTDLMILASPLPVIRQLQMPMETRIAAACILLLGAVVCSAGITRFVIFLRIGSGMVENGHDLTYYTVPVFSWSMIETSLAVVSANLPLLRPLLHRITRSCSWSTSLIRTKTSTDSTMDEESTEATENEPRISKESSVRSFLSFELRPPVPPSAQQVRAWLQTSSTLSRRPSVLESHEL